MVPNTDRFAAIDHRNQNLVDKVLRERADSIKNKTDQTADAKAREVSQSSLSI